MPAPIPAVTSAVRWLLVVFFVAAGGNHFRDPAFYQVMMPPWLPWHDALIAISGIAEIAGGLGLILPATRRVAGYGLIALLIAVFPANLHMAMEQRQYPGLPMSTLGLWLRLPFQLPMLFAVWLVALRRPTAQGGSTGDGGSDR